MRIDALFGSLCNRLRAFQDCKRGNVITMFALATLPIVGFVGAAVDYSRGNSAKVAMQAAIDATGLMLSKDAQTLTQDQLGQRANDAFIALFHRPDVTNLVITPDFTSPTTSSFKLVLTVTGTVPTTFTKILGHEYMNLDVKTEVVWGVKKLELALALDVTGSMASNNKMTELKKAAKSLLTTLKNAAKTDGDIRVAIAPFAVNVNVDAATNVNAGWLDWSHWMAEPAVMTGPTGWIANNATTWSRTGPGSSCPFSNSNHGFRCTSGPSDAQNDSTVNNVPSSGANAGLICPSRNNGSKSTAATGLLTNSYPNGCYDSVEKPSADWYTVSSGSNASCGGNPNCSCSGSGGSTVCKQKTYTHTWRPRPKTAWNGCVRDRNQNFDAQSTAPTFPWANVTATNLNGVAEDYRTAVTPTTAEAFQPHQFQSCPAKLLPLTYNWTALNDKIDELQPTGNTNVSIGLAWGFHALTASEPLSNALPASPDLDKVIILLTDGDNTQNRWTNTGADIDARTTATCNNVKAANIKLYTIRVIDGNATLLQACATKPDMYYNVQNASQLNSVFTTIAQNLANLRIAK